MRQEAARSPTRTVFSHARFRPAVPALGALAVLLAALVAAAAQGAEPRPLYRMLVVKLPVPIKQVEALTCPGLAPDALVRYPQRPGTPDPSAVRPPVPVVMVVDEKNHRSQVRLVDQVPVVEPLGDCRPPERGERPDLLDGARLEIGTGYIAEAWLAVPTLKYRHGILGDVVTAQELRVVNRRGDTLPYRLPDDAVFEDRWARLVIVDRQDAVLVVRTGLRTGAALALFGLDRPAAEAGGLVLLAQSASLGAPNRWLNPAGVGDFDGSGHTQIAAVLTPHKGGVLAVYQRQGGKLVQRYKASGFSNHQIYSAELGMAATLDANGDGILDLAVPDAERTALRIVTFAHGRFAELQRFPHESPIVSAIAAQTLTPGVTSLVYALENGTVVVLTK